MYAIETEDVVPSAVLIALRNSIASRQAVNMDFILAQAGVGRTVVMEALEKLVAMREVEVLCPVTAGGGYTRMPTFHPLEHYRLIRPTDRDYAWQVDIGERMLDRQGMAEREWQSAVRMPDRISDSVWILPWRPYAYAAG